MVAIKDYVWEKTSKGWGTRWCPLGEGMVNWNEFFQALAHYPFPGPMSIHIEYDPGGSTRPERIDNSLAAAQRDITFVRRQLAEASSKK
jgi:sugar phosphate isomerase/epimerase